MLEKACKRHFQNIDTNILMAQFVDLFFITLNDNVKPWAFLQYKIFEQIDIMQLICELIAKITDHEKHNQRLKTLQTRHSQCKRKKSRYRI